MSRGRLWVATLPPLALAVLAQASPARAEPSLAETTQNLQELAAPVTRTQFRFDFGLAMGTRVVTTASGEQRRPGGVEVGLEIAPRPDYWYGLGFTTNVHGVTVVQTTTTYSQDGTTRTVAEIAERESAFSARIFKRVGIAVLSAGFIENGPGAAAELRGAGDLVRLEVAAWAPLGLAGLRARARVGGSVGWKNLYAQAGVQDLFDRDWRTPYLGMGLRWTDADLMSAAFWLLR